MQNEGGLFSSLMISALAYALALVICDYSGAF
jgi:hypothetical protein